MKYNMPKVARLALLLASVVVMGQGGPCAPAPGDDDGNGGTQDGTNGTAPATIAGTLDVINLNVPAGQTTTATSDVVIHASGNVTIDGLLTAAAATGAGASITINAEGDIDVNGTIVIDGCLGDFFTERYASLAETPVTVKVENGRALRNSLRCTNDQLRADLSAYVFETDENSSRIGEFAIGTNTGLTKLIYNLLQDEKFPGVHVAFGSPLPGRTGADWDSKAHVDGVIIAPTIHVDGQTLMEKGRFCFD